MLNGCSKLIAAVFLVLFVVVTPMVLLLLNVDFLVLGPGLYKRALAEQNFYARLTPLMVEMIGRGAPSNPCAENPSNPSCQGEVSNDPRDDLVVKIVASARLDLKTCLQKSLGEAVFNALANARRLPNVSETGLTKTCVKKFGYPTEIKTNQGAMPSYFWILEPADWQVILTALGLSDWLPGTTENTLDQFFAYLDRKSDVVKISLRDLKSRFQGEPGKTILAQLLRAQPPCTQEQLARMLAGTSGTASDGMTWCRPPDEMMSAAMTEIQKTASRVIPSEVDLTSRLQPSSSPSRAEDIRDSLGRVHLFLRLSILVPLILFGLMTLFGVRSLAGLLRWWGVPLLLIGMIGGGIALLVWLGMDVAFAAFLSSNRNIAIGLPPDLLNLVQDVAKQIARTFMLWFGDEAAIIGALGLAMLFGAFLARRSGKARLVAAN